MDNNNIINNEQPSIQPAPAPAPQPVPAPAPQPAPAPAPAPAPVQSVEPLQMNPQYYPQPGQQQYQQSYQQPTQQPYQQPYQQQYQPQYQQPYQQIQPQYVAQQNQEGTKTSEYDLLSPAEKAARRKQANILCFISLGLHFIPEMISGMLTGIVDSISKTADIGSTSEVLSIIISVLFGGSYVASWVLMIMARVKYKESRFAKILMWVYIGILAAGIIAVILVIAMCAYILKDCQGF